MAGGPATLALLPRFRLGHRFDLRLASDRNVDRSAFIVFDGPKFVSACRDRTFGSILGDAEDMCGTI
jgi:hypothetical protein